MYGSADVWIFVGAGDVPVKTTLTAMRAVPVELWAGKASPVGMARDANSTVTVATTTNGIGSFMASPFEPNGLGD